MPNGSVKRWQDDAQPDDYQHPGNHPEALIVGPPPRPILWFYYSLAVAPTVAHAIVWAFSWRASWVIGHWPRPMLDDPKFVAPDDMLCAFLYFAAFPCMLWSVLGIFMLPVITLLFRRVYSPLRLVGVLLFFAITVSLMRIDPGLRFTWLMD